MRKFSEFFQKFRKGPSNGDEAGSEPVPVGTVTRKTVGWVSPSYTHSRSIPLNPMLMEENRCIGYFPNLPEVEFYRVLRTQILRRTQGGNALMVTSALPEEGKTLTAVNLSLTIAKEFDNTVLLVDCDLRRQNIHKILGIPGEKGLVDYFLDNCPLQDLIVWPSVEKMTLISGGKTIEGSSELLGSPRMKGLVSEMKKRYPERYVIFDVPPVLSTADALAFASLVDHILVVVRAGKTPMPDVKRAIDMLPKEKVVGFVLNRNEVPENRNYYYKYYASPHTPQTQAPGRIPFRELSREKLDSQIVNKVAEDPDPALQKKLPVAKPPQKTSVRTQPPPKKKKSLLRKLSYSLLCLAGVGLIIFAGRTYLKTPEEIPDARFRVGHSTLEEKSTLLPPEKNTEPLQKPSGGPAPVPPPESGKSKPGVSPPPHETDKEVSLPRVVTRPTPAPRLSSTPAVPGPPGAGMKREMTVKAGNSIYTIARKAYHVANTSVVDRILTFNSAVSNPNHLAAGQKVRIPEITEESLLIVSPTGTCKVRLGTFLKPGYASFLKDQPGLRGKEIEILPHRLPSGQTWYRVVAGPFLSREEGLKMIRGLRERGLSPYFLEFKGSS